MHSDALAGDLFDLIRGPSLDGGKRMKTATTAVAAGMLALAAVAAPSAADAGCRGCVAAGVLGGLAAGAIIGGAIANSAPPPGYAPYPAYAAPVPVACPVGGYWARRPLVDRFGNFIGYSQPEFFCR
jgi:hypothetical protein